MADKEAAEMIPRIDMEGTGRKIRGLMERGKVRPCDIMERCGFTTTNVIYKWMHGKSLPTIDNLVILADLLNTTIDEILAIER